MGKRPRQISTCTSTATSAQQPIADEEDEDEEDGKQQEPEFDLAAMRKAAQGKQMTEAEKKARGLLYDTSKARAVREESSDDEDDDCADFDGGDPFEGL